MKLFERNTGTVDRLVRIAAGAALLSLTCAGPQTLWGLVGLVPLATGLAGTCPAYSLLGLRTDGRTRAASAL